MYVWGDPQVPPFYETRVWIIIAYAHTLYRWKEQESYIDSLLSKLESSSASEVAKLKDSESKLQLQVQESTRRENVLNMRLATKQQEMQDLMVNSPTPTNSVLRSCIFTGQLFLYAFPTIVKLLLPLFLSPHTHTHTHTHSHTLPSTVSWIFPSPSQFHNLIYAFEIWFRILIPNITKSQVHDLKQAQNSENSQLHQTLIDPAVNLVFERMKSQLTDYKDKLDQAQSDLSAWKFTPDRLAAQRDHVLPHTRIRKLTLLLLNIDPKRYSVYLNSVDVYSCECICTLCVNFLTEYFVSQLLSVTEHRLLLYVVVLFCVFICARLCVLNPLLIVSGWTH